MPAFARVDRFVAYAKSANSSLGKRKTSSLQPLIDILNDVNGTPLQVCNAIAALPEAKTKKYINALYFLLAKYPGLSANAATNLQLGVLGKTDAVRYQQTPLPANYQPNGNAPNHKLANSASALLGQTIEQYLLINRANTGVMLIHLSSDQPGMDNIYAGKTCIQHINSAIFVAGLVDCPVLALTMEATREVTGALRDNYLNALYRIRVFDPLNHTGGRNQPYRDFADACTNVVVMGFDGTVCVPANVFGSVDEMPDGSFCDPLATRANIVMSRSTLVNTDNLWTKSPTFGQLEYGPLYQT